MSESTDVLGRIETARRYTANLLSEVAPADWFRMPKEGVTHIAWQVGHLAFAEYSLALARIRGKQPEDERLVPAPFFQLFGRSSEPSDDVAAYPTIEEIRRVFDSVHHQVQTELAKLTVADLEAPIAAPHRLFTTKRGALDWCAQHEMLHAGQIGLLRRLLGAPPMW